ncbi:MAG: hypothetical protein COX51_04340 [Syntrophobacteraceae bacterium CG23_combo_of_CG06-09_8_20_14_all_50_8]|nr:MAG: hypothetical protein COX51_04340 [Syntrophobacteraceae bacterium CG23_combo_of_CG06-09_8_20_14_all_50_8]
MLRSSFILPFDKLRTGYLPLMVSCEPVEQSNHACLACRAFYEAIEFNLFFDFLRVHQSYAKLQSGYFEERAVLLNETPGLWGDMC